MALFLCLRDYALSGLSGYSLNIATWLWLRVYSLPPIADWLRLRQATQERKERCKGKDAGS